MRLIRVSVAVSLLGVPAVLAWSTHARSVAAHAPAVVRPTDSDGPDGAIRASSRADVICGVVVRADGKAMKGASVQLRQGDRSLGPTTTDPRGWFAFEKIAPGVYEVPFGLPLPWMPQSVRRR